MCACRSWPPRVGAIAEVVLEGRTALLVEPGDVPALARAIDQLLSDAARRAALSEAATRRPKAFS